MTKKFYFLAGLPRSGNTLLAALLNQNPLIFCSPTSPLMDHMSAFINSMESPFNVRNAENFQRSKNTLGSIAESFYSEIKEDIIIDRHKYWGNEYHLEMIKKRITPDPKIIVTVRSIPEILASLIKLDGHRLFREAASMETVPREYMHEDDRACDYLMRVNGPIDTALLTVATALHDDYKHMFHIVEYDDIVNNPSKVMMGIYEFLGMIPFEHDFNNIKKREFDNDKYVGIHPDTHKIRSSISKSKTDPSMILSEYILNKYSGIDFWRENATLRVRKNNWIKVG
jgi:sulfotransferase